MSRIAYFECREGNHNKFYLMTEDPCAQNLWNRKRICNGCRKGKR